MSVRVKASFGGDPDVSVDSARKAFLAAIAEMKRRKLSDSSTLTSS